MKVSIKAINYTGVYKSEIVRYEVSSAMKTLKSFLLDIEKRFGNEKELEISLSIKPDWSGVDEHKEMPE